MKGTANPPEPLNPVDIGSAVTSALIISLFHTHVLTVVSRIFPHQLNDHLETQLSEGKGWK